MCLYAFVEVWEIASSRMELVKLGINRDTKLSVILFIGSRVLRDREREQVNERGSLGRKTTSNPRSRRNHFAATPMRYHDGSTIMLGDIVSVPMPSGTEKARVVMLGDTYEHLDIDKQFLSWVKKEKVLDESSIVIEWLNKNPLAHDNSQYAPVGNYMFTTVDTYVKKVV